MRFFWGLLFPFLFLSAQPEEKVWIRIPSSYSPRVAQKAKKAYEEIRVRLTKILNFKLSHAVVIAICANHHELEELLGQSLPRWVFGVAFPKRYLIGIDGSKIDVITNTLSSVIQHETCHLYLGVWERTKHRKLPLWFNEGVCEWVSQSLHLTYQQELMDSVVFHRILPFSSLEYRFPKKKELALQAYLQSRSMIEYIVIRYGKDAIAKILQNYEKSGLFSDAIELSFGISQEKLERNWEINISPPIPWLWLLIRMVSLFTFLAFGVIFAYYLQRRRDRRILERWEQEEEWETNWNNFFTDFTKGDWNHENNRDQR